MRKLRRASIEWDRGGGIGELQENLRTTKTDIECKTNDDVPERSITTTYDLIFV